MKRPVFIPGFFNPHMNELSSSNVLFFYTNENTLFKIINNELVCAARTKKIIYNPNGGTKLLKKHVENKMHQKNTLRKELQPTLAESSLVTLCNKDLAR